MRVVCLNQLGLLVAVAAGIGAGVGCGEAGTEATSTVTSELHPMPKASPFEAKVRQSNLVADQDGFARKTDPDLQNAWGVAFKGRSIWIAANHTRDGSPVQ